MLKTELRDAEGYYRALVRFLSCMPSHMNYQHVLSFEGLFVTRAFLPATNKTFLIGVNMIVVDMLDKVVLRGKFLITIPPVTMGLDEITWFVLHRVP